MEAETELTKAATVPLPSASSHITHTSFVEEGRFISGTLLAGRYRIVGLLGRGGMGEVYRATDLTLGQSVALKFLPPTAENQFLLERFHSEVRVARQISHPNVCRVYDIGETEGMPFISMEYVDGEDLAALLPRIGRLTGSRAIEAAREICAGLAAAHSKGVIHRDLKPHNIMMNKRGEIVIMDFGLAAIADQLSGPEARNGTPAYMSPEQLKGTEVTPRSDIYALGLVLYEIFTGRKPYDAKNVRELIGQEEAARFTSMNSLATDIDPAVETVVRRCLDPDPARRPESALAVSAALPGGDPLAVALAAGETPSPELVAASGRTEGIARKYALLCVGIVLACMVALPLLKQRTEAFLQAHSDYPPDVLKQKGRDIAASFGYPGHPVDSALWLDQQRAVLTYLDRLPQPGDWNKWLASESPGMATYRESPEPMVAEPTGTLTETNPPVTVPGMTELTMDAAGRLRGFLAVPSSAGAAMSAPIAPEAVFAALGFDAAAFTETAPNSLPTVPTDALRAWTGQHPGIPGLRPRVEMGWWKGRLTYARLTWPWTTAAGVARTNPVIAQLQGALLPVLSAIALLFAILLAHRNWRRERADRRGAFVIGLTQFVLAFVAWAMSVHPVASSSMFELTGNAFSDALTEGAVFLILYLALEPALRSRWPHSIITWNRVLAGRWRDAQVCSHILVGLALGGVLITIPLVRDAYLAGKEGLGSMGGFYLLNGTRFWISGMAERVSEAISTGLTIFFVMFALRVLLRRDWIAATVVVIVFTALQGDLANSVYWQSQLAIYLLLIATLIFVLLRMGLLVTVTAVFSLNALNAITLGTDWGAWYAPAGFATIALLSALTLYVFRQSLGDRELLGD